MTKICYYKRTKDGFKKTDKIEEDYRDCPSHGELYNLKGGNYTEEVFCNGKGIVIYVDVFFKGKKIKRLTSEEYFNNN